MPVKGGREVGGGCGCSAAAGARYIQTSEEGCWSKVGMQLYGRHALNLEDPGCCDPGTIAHELGMAQKPFLDS